MDAPSRESRRRLLHRLDRQRTIVAAGLVGALAGAVAVAFRLVVERAEGFGQTLARTHSGAGGLLLMAALGAALGALAGFLTERYAPDAGGSGVPQAKGAILGLRPIRHPWRLAAVKIVGGCAALSAGFSAGREGPTIHLGAAIGEIFGRVGRVPMRSRRTLVAAGAGAGLAAAFNAPLAGFLFVMEELKREMSPLTYATALVGSVVAVGVAQFALGGGSSFNLPVPPTIPLSRLPAMILVGVATGLVGVVFNRALMAGSGWRMGRVPRWLAGAVVGLATGLLLALWPDVTGGGHGLAERGLRGELLGDSFGLLLGLLAAKLALTVASYSTGVPGGFFAPLLVMGSLIGLLVGRLLLPMGALAVAPPVLASVGMAAILAGSLRAPLTGVVLIIEMTGQYGLLYDLLVAAFVAYATAELLHDVPIYEALLERDLHGGAPVAEHEGEVIEAFVESGSRLDGAPIRALRLPENVTIAVIEREGRTLAPRGSTVLRPGDHVTAVVGAEGPMENALAVVDAARAP